MGNPSIHRIERMNYGIGAALILLAVVTQPKPIALGIATGTALTCLNFFILRKLIVKWTTAAQEKKHGYAPMLMLPKMTGLMVAVAAVVLFLPVDVVAFVIGYSIFVVSITIEAMYSALRTPEPSE